METLRGIVEALKNNPASEKRKENYGIKVGGEWYNGWGVSPVNKGDIVLVHYVLNGTYKNIDHVEKAEAGNEPAKSSTVQTPPTTFEAEAVLAVQKYTKIYDMMVKDCFKHELKLDGEVSAVTACFIEANKKSSSR